MSDAVTPATWRSAVLRDVMVESDERAGAHEGLPLLSVTKHDGAVLAKERFSRVLAGKNLSRYRVARRGSIVIDPMLLWDGVIALQHRFDAGLVSPDYRVFQLDPSVDPKFFDYLAHSSGMRRQYSAAARGTNVRRRRIHRDDFLAIEVLLPPLAEQVRISTVLSSIDQRVAATGVAAERALVLLTQLMRALFSGDAERVVPLNEMIAPGRPICYGVLKPGPNVPDGIPVIRIQDYSDDALRAEVVQRSAREIVSEFERSTLHAGDILVSIRGTAGRVCVVPPELEGANISRDSARVSLADPRLREVVALYLRSPVAQEFVMGEMRGLAVRGINIEDLRRLPVPLFTDGEREKIVRILAALREYVRALLHEAEALRNLSAALASELLSSRRRLPLEPKAA